MRQFYTTSQSNAPCQSYRDSFQNYVVEVIMHAGGKFAFDIELIDRVLLA